MNEKANVILGWVPASDVGFELKEEFLASDGALKARDSEYLTVWRGNRPFGGSDYPAGCRMSCGFN